MLTSKYVSSLRLYGGEKFFLENEKKIEKDTDEWLRDSSGAQI